MNWLFRAGLLLAIGCGEARTGPASSPERAACVLSPGTSREPDARSVERRLLDPRNDDSAAKWARAELQRLDEQVAAISRSDLTGRACRRALARLTEEVFVSAIHAPTVFMGDTSEQPGLVPLRRLGRNALPWVVQRLRAQSLPQNGHDFTAAYFAVALLGEFGNESHIAYLERLLARGAAPMRDMYTGSHHVSVIVRALYLLGSKRGVQYCVEALTAGELDEMAGACWEALAHLIGDVEWVKEPCDAVVDPPGSRTFTCLLGHERPIDWAAWWARNKDRPISRWDRGTLSHVH